MSLKISSRQSNLAKLQSYSVGAAVESKHAGIKAEFNFKQSLGDINLTDPLWKMPGKGVFTEDFYNDLIEGNTDLVVHSWKDLPVEDKEHTEIVASLPRADQRDLLLVKKSHFENVKKNRVLKIYSSSPRRAYNLEPFFKNYFPCVLDQVEFISVRGNIPTRLNKYIQDQEIDGIILAKAALDRLLSTPRDDMSEMKTEIRQILNNSQWMVLPLSENPNAAAQGALAIEIKKDRQDLKELLWAINNQDSFDSASKERAILKSYGGGCHQKIGVAVINHTYGTITITRGLTDQNVALDSTELFHEGQKTISKKFSSENLWSIPSAKAFFDEHSEKWNNPSLSNLFISKTFAMDSAALAELQKAPVLWTAGNQTWKKLAQQGVWVNGSNEGFGEDFPLHTEHLSEEKKWIKLAHKESAALNAHSKFETVPAYRIERNAAPFNFKNEACFFWNSSSLFFAALKENPEIINGIHCCGLGNTAKNIQRHLDNHFKTNTLWSKLFVFLDQDQWRNHVTQ